MMPGSRKMGFYGFSLKKMLFLFLFLFSFFFSWPKILGTCNFDGFSFLFVLFCFVLFVLFVCLFVFCFCFCCFCFYCFVCLFVCLFFAYYKRKWQDYFVIRGKNKYPQAEPSPTPYFDCLPYPYPYPYPN